MKKLYFLNEEESIRILNLHKDATKRQYLSEELPFTSVDIASTKTPIDSKSFNYQDYNTPTNDVYGKLGNPTDKKDPTPISRSTDRELWKKYPCIVNHPKAKETIEDDGEIYYDLNDFTYYTDGTKIKWTKGPNGGWIEGKTVPFTCNDAEFKTITKQPVTPCPVGKGTKPEVMAFQDWLDDNKKGWLPKYPDGLNSEVKKGYGLCGPNTRRAWSDTTLQSMYLAGQTNKPETMTAKKVSTTIQEPSQERELKLTTTNTSTGTPVASTTVATAAQPDKTPVTYAPITGDMLTK
jgi:hypothetical protein